jgi:hypothetical protein
MQLIAALILIPITAAIIVMLVIRATVLIPHMLPLPPALHLALPLVHLIVRIVRIVPEHILAEMKMIIESDVSRSSLTAQIAHLSPLCRPVD